MKFSTFEALVDSAAYRDAGQRVVRQLLEALLFEGALPDVAWLGDMLSIPGTDAAGEALFYRCNARRTVSFGRIRIVSSVCRVQHGAETVADDVARVVAELGPKLGPIRFALPSSAPSCLPRTSRMHRRVLPRRESRCARRVTTKLKRH